MVMRSFITGALCERRLCACACAWNVHECDCCVLELRFAPPEQSEIACLDLSNVFFFFALSTNVPRKRSDDGIMEIPVVSGMQKQGTFLFYSIESFCSHFVVHLFRIDAHTRSCVSAFFGAYSQCTKVNDVLTRQMIYLACARFYPV